MRWLHRTLDRVDVPVRPMPLGTPDFRRAIVAGVLAVGALVAAAGFGNIHGKVLHTRVIAGAGAAAFLVFAVLAVRSAGREVQRVLRPRAGTGHAAVIRLLIQLAGYAITLLMTLGLLAVPVQHLLLGGALTGVILGIAAQQALGNIFSGLVLVIARPFNVGDTVRVRSGTYGGEFSGRVTGMGLTYVTVQLPDGPLSIPNSGMLAAGIGPVPGADEDLDDTGPELAGARTEPSSGPDGARATRSGTTSEVVANDPADATQPLPRAPR
jgi:small-conductance mechanosensitive channel